MITTIKAQTASFFSGLLLLTWCALSLAESRPPQILNRKNAGDAPHHLTIGSNDIGDGNLRFTVTIRAKDPKLPLDVIWGHLSVHDGERFICQCRVHAQSDKDSMQFEFLVAPACLEKSSFSFSAATVNAEERKKLPTGAGWANYQFTLRDFAGADQDRKVQAPVPNPPKNQSGPDVDP